MAELEATVEALQTRDAAQQAELETLRTTVRSLEARPAPVARGPFEGITEVSPDHVQVKRTTLDLDTMPIEDLASLGRAIQHKAADGSFDGYRLSGLRRDTLPTALGLKNGDIVHTLNGAHLDSIDAALKAFEEHKSSESFDVGITRRGESVHLRVEILD